MTLLVSVLTQDCVWQVADRLLTKGRTGRPVDTDADKAVHFARAIAGPAELEGEPTAPWIADRLAAGGDPEMAVSAHEFSRRTGLGPNTASRLRAGKRSQPTAQTMLAIEREFGWPVAEQVGAVAEGRYTREINERVFQKEERAA